MAGPLDSHVLDEVVKKRLLNDGDGVGDDKRFAQLIKDFHDLMSNPIVTEDCAALLDRIKAGIEQVKHNAIRDFVAVDLNEDTSDRFLEVREQITTNIAETQEEIVELKVHLAEAQKQRKYSAEYDTLARLIDTQPDRVETENRLKKLSADTESYTKMKKCLEKNYKMREHTMHLVRPVVESLQNFVTEMANPSSTISQKNRERENYSDLSESGEDDGSAPASKPNP